jgi:hypothetical protein
MPNRSHSEAAPMNATHTEAAGKAKEPSLSEVTGAVALALGLIFAWLCSAGWTYAYDDFDRFGVPLLMVEIPKEYYFVYGGVVLPWEGSGSSACCPITRAASDWKSGAISATRRVAFPVAGGDQLGNVGAGTGSQRNVGVFTAKDDD